MQTPTPDIHDLTSQAVALQKRLAQLAAEAGSFAQGLQEVGRGLETILENLPAVEAAENQRAHLMRAHFLALLHGLEGIADYLTSTESSEQNVRPEPAPAASAQNPFAGLQQFIAAFRKEAQKRLAGLSISMMGIFNEATSTPALEQSAGHLHAVRGGAAMLGLQEIAELAGTMEQLLVTMGRIDAQDRIWPTKTLLQGYALLRDAAENEDARVDAAASAAIVAELRHCLAALVPTEKSPPVDAPTNVTAPAAVLRRAASSASEAIEVSSEVVEETGEAVGDVSIPETPEPEVVASLVEDLSMPAEIVPDAEVSEVPTREVPVEELPVEAFEQRILIVDDIDTIAASVGFVLSDLDVAMDVAHDGQIALKMLREQPYSLVISDVAMPIMDGLELTRVIRADEKLRHLPVILLTSLSEPEARQAGLDAGATDYIIKGAIGGGALVTRVEELLKTAPFVAPRKDTQPWKILVAEDTETVAASIAFVLSEGPYDITLAHDGHDALRQLQRRRFDLLITDVQMPRMDGIELTQAVRAQNTLQDLPIIMLTSLDGDEDRERGLTVGVDRYLIKGEIAGGKLLSMMDDLLTSGRDL